LPQWRPANFLPLPARPRATPRAGTPSDAGIPREPRKPSGRHPSLRFGPKPGASAIAFGLSIAIEAAMGAVPSNRDRSDTMATIGSFTKSSDGAFSGTIKTLTLAIKARFIPVEKKSDKAPDLRVVVGAPHSIEIGAGWLKTSRDGRDYHAVTLDDPSFPAPIYANLVEDKNGDSYSLIWSRPSGH
jgi:uncharacterized protein (DUF736 family)